MLLYTPKDVAEILDAQIVNLHEDAVCEGVCIDSRDIKQNDIFFALKGEVTDGHLFLESACKNGASLLIVQRADENIPVTQVVVDDTFLALQNFAKAYIKRFPIPFIAVTGSSGKTTTKDLIASILSEKYRVRKTRGNLNSTTGVPLTLFDLMPEDEIAVIEISMSHPGEILGNVDIVRPQVAVITNVGLCHIEFLKTQENIFKAKSEVLTYLKKDDYAILNYDDKYLSQIRDRDFHVVGCGIENGDFRAVSVQNTSENVRFSINIQGKEEQFTFPIPGNHNVTNALLAIRTALIYHLTPDEIRRGIRNFVPSKNRMQIVEQDDVTLINDSYNANPDSVKATIDTLKHLSKGRSIAVLGDMYELGEASESMHFSCGAYAARKKIDIVFCAGTFANTYKEGFLSENPSGEIYSFVDKQSLSRALSQTVQKGDTVLFKASRGMALEEVFNSLKEKLHHV